MARLLLPVLVFTGMLVFNLTLIQGHTQVITGQSDPTFTLKSEWTVTEARIHAMKNIESRTDLTDFGGMDPYLFENLKALETDDYKIANRQLTYFDGGFYAVAYDGEDRVEYYQPDGSLVKVSLCDQDFGPGSQFPRRCIDYSYPEGKFVAVSLDVDTEESFVFSSRGTLLQHWQGEQGFDKNGKPQFERYRN